MQRIPSTQALQCFESSARLGSFTLAGHELCLTQGGVSRQVIGLEERLGFALLSRRKLGLQLTPAGRAYLDEVAPALRALERATANVMALKGEGGVLNLSIPASWGNHWLMVRLPRFAVAHPQISLNVLTKVGSADFSNRQIDAAVEYRPTPRADMPSDFVMCLSLAPYAAPDFKRRYGTRVAESAMLQHSTLPDAWQAWCTLSAGENRARVSVTPSGPRYDLMFMAMNAAAAGLGAALLPKWLAEPLVQSRRLAALSKLEWQAPGGYYLSQSPLTRSERSVSSLREWLRAEAQLDP